MRTDDAAVRAGKILRAMAQVPAMYAVDAPTFVAFAQGVLAMASEERRYQDAWSLALRNVRNWRLACEVPWHTLTYDDAIPVVMEAARLMGIEVPE
jgi:hypothetical protein